MIKKLALLKTALIYVVLFLAVMMFTSCTAPERSDAPSNAAAGGGGTGVTVSSNPSSVSTFGLASITATVRDSSGSLAADGTAVTFSLSDSTKGTLSSGTATTTGGTARVNFTAGNNTGTVSITATSGGLTGSVAVTISASATAALSMMATPNAIPVSGTSTITTHVVDGTGNPVVNGTAISFSLDDPTKGSLSSSSVFTSNGDGQVTFTASPTASGTVKVTATSGGKTGYITISITGGIAGGTMTMTASSAAITTNGTSTITANIKDSGGNPITGALVSFTLNNTAATLSTPTTSTDANGNAIVTLTAGAVAGSVTVTANSSTLTSLTTITISPAAGVGTMTLTASPTSITTNSTSTITATIKNGANQPLSGVTVTFSLSNSAATLGSLTSVTNASGVAQVVLTSGVSPTSVTVSATATVPGPAILNGSATVTITAPLPASLSIAVNPSSITVLGTATITATVKDSLGNAVLDGTAVSFSESSPLYGALSSATTTTANSNGTATTTFTGSKTAGTVTITASAGTVSSTTAITVVPASTGSISFVSATPQVIGIKSSGQPASSAVKFLVNDINGNPVSDGTAVSFKLKGPGGGEYIGDVDATLQDALGSTVNGNATVILNSGTVAGPVTITASTDVNAGTPTTLLAAIDGFAKTITVASITDPPFHDSRRIRIDNELIDYTGKTATTFTNCTRGVVGTLAGAHSIGTKVYNQEMISSSATQISIGGGVPSATHLTLATERGKINLPGFAVVGAKSAISAYLADRFGNYNVLEGQSVSFYTEAGAIERQGVTTITDTVKAGIATVDLRTQNPMPKDVARGLAGDSISNAYFGGANEPWYTFGTRTYNPRDGWVAVFAATQGEEAFADENVDGQFTRSYSSTSICPYGFICECDGGVNNGYASSVSGGASCATGWRSEGFVDMGEPFYDVNDDGVRDNGLTAGKPFELWIDSNGDGKGQGVYNGPNGMWDGPDCLPSPLVLQCEKTKMIWLETKSVFSGGPIFYPWPDANNCYNTVTDPSPCSATYSTTGARLTVALTAGATTITVADTTGYPTSGLLKIDNELISYSGTTLTTFTGCARAQYSTTAASHLLNAAVDGQFNSSFAIAPATIARGKAGKFTVVVGDINLNGLEAGTKVKVSAINGTVSPSNIPDISDGVSTGSTMITFSVAIPNTSLEITTTVTVEVTTPSNLSTYTTVVVPII